jgi:hypothetical protein
MLLPQLETLTTTQKSMKAMKENNTKHGNGDVLVSMETQASMNRS